jgi:hypothetical protein
MPLDEMGLRLIGERFGGGPNQQRILAIVERVARLNELKFFSNGQD